MSTNHPSEGSPSAPKQRALLAYQGKLTTRGEEATKILMLIKNRICLAILDLLSDIPEMNVKETCEYLKEAEPYVSMELSLLREAQLVNRRKDHKNAFYSLHRQENILPMIADALEHTISREKVVAYKNSDERQVLFGDPEHSLTASGRSVIRMAKMFQSEARLRIMAHFHNAPYDVEEMAALTKLSQPDVSYHLNLLRQSGFLSCEKYGKYHYYSSTNTANTPLPDFCRQLRRLGGCIDPIADPAPLAKGMAPTSSYDRELLETAVFDTSLFS